MILAKSTRSPGADRSAAWLGAIALCLLAATAAGAEGETAPDPSQAERLLFMTEHLADLKAPATLRYRFDHTEATAAASFNDNVEIKLVRGNAVVCCNASGTFLSGARAMNPPEVPDARANPVLLYFLEYEVRQLQRTTRGQAAHFRKRIRLALVDKAELTPTRIEWGGREVAATLVQISPYLDDPFRNRFAREARKTYSFVMSDAVPGGIYQIRTRVPEAEGGATAVEESLTLLPR